MELADNEKHRNRIVELDAIRGVGSIAVLVFHLWPIALFSRWSRADLFFVLSGYLIGSTLASQCETWRSVSQFWTARAVRILPAYFAMISIALIADATRGNHIDIGFLASHISFTEDLPYYWLGHDLRTPDTAHVWSLAIEVQFYIIWPIVMLVAKRWATALIAISLIIASVTFRAIGLCPSVALARCDGLMLGYLLSLMEDEQASREWRKRWRTILIATLGVPSILYLAAPELLIGSSLQAMSESVSLSLLATNIVYACSIDTIVCYRGHWLLRPLRSKVLCYLGKISYGTYLYQMIIINKLSEIHFINHRGGHGVAVALIILSAVLSRNLIELPAVKSHKKQSASAQ